MTNKKEEHCSTCCEAQYHRWITQETPDQFDCDKDCRECFAIICWECNDV